MKDFSISPKKLKNILKSYIDFFFSKEKHFFNFETYNQKIEKKISEVRKNWKNI